MVAMPKYVPEAQRAVMTRASCPIKIEDAQEYHAQPILDHMSRIARQAKSPDYLKLDTVCSRPRCSRCLSQLHAEGWLRIRNFQITAVTFEKATEIATKYTRAIVGGFVHLAAHKTSIVSALRALNEQKLKEVVVDSFPGLQKNADLHSWNNLEPDKVTFRQSLPFGSLTYEGILERPETLQELIEKHGDRHPADFVQEMERDIEPGWNEGQCPTATSACFVDLTKAGFGQVKKPFMNGLHQDGIYTFMKAFSILYHQFRLYRALYTMGAAIVPVMPEPSRMTFEPNMIPSVDTPKDTPQALQEALQGAINALQPAEAALEELILASMSSGEMLERQYNERASWVDWTTEPGRGLVGECQRKEAFLMATAEPLMNVSMLYALERDASRCRTTARDYSRKRATKTALLRDWESLELALALCVEHFSLTLAWSGRKGSVADATDITSFDCVTDDCGRQGIAPHHQLLYLVGALQNHRQPLKHRIGQLLKYVDAQGDARSCFHGSADFVFLGLTAIQKLIDAMGLLQPVSAREYGKDYGNPLPDYGGAVEKQEPVVRMYMVNHPDHAFQPRVWEKLGLTAPGVIQAQYKEAWAEVFNFVEQVWRREGTDEGVLSRVLDLRKRGKVPPVKPDANDDTKKSKLASAAETQVEKEQQAAVPSMTVAADPQHATPPIDIPRLGVEVSPAPARKARTTPMRARPLVSEMERALAELQFVDKPSRPSMFPEEITWAEKQQRRNRNDSAKESSSPEEKEDPPATPSPNEAEVARPSKIVFADAKTYKSWRTMFPLHAEGDNGGRLKFDDLCALLTAPPLNFRIAADGGRTLRFHREKSDGWPEGVVTIHKGHGWNPKVSKHELDLIKKDLRREFGWTAEDFELAS